MTSGMYIVAVCAVGGLIAGLAFVWAMRSGQFAGAEEARYLVFDGDDAETPSRPVVPPSSRPPA